MSLIPGIAGQKTELFDGAKIDAISEYTSGNGVQIQGRTNTSTLTSANVGYTIIQSRLNASGLSLTTGVGANVTASPIVIPAGIWSLSGGVFFNLSSTLAWANASLSKTSSTPGGVYATYDSDAQIQVLNLTGATAGIAHFVTLPTYTFVTSGVTLYLVGVASFAGVCSVSGYIQATRIA